MHLVRKVLYSVVSVFQEWLWQEKHLLTRILTQQKKKLSMHLGEIFVVVPVIKRLSKESSLLQQFFEEMQRLTMTLKEETSTVSDRKRFVWMCERKYLDMANIQMISLWMVWYIYPQYAANTLVQKC